MSVTERLEAAGEVLSPAVRSKPPSSDPPQAKAKAQAKRRRRRQKSRHCGTSLAGAPVVGSVGRHQVMDLPPVRAHITEHQTFTHACSECGRRTRAELPAELSGKHFGPRLVAFSALLLSRFRMSRRGLAAFYSDLLDVPGPALGTTQAFCLEVSAALLSPCRAIRGAVRRSRLAGADETSWWLRSPTAAALTTATPPSATSSAGRT